MVNCVAIIVFESSRLTARHLRSSYAFLHTEVPVRPVLALFPPPEATD